MLLCKMCIEKKLPSYTYNNENFGRQFCEECQSETQHLDYENFKNKLFEVITTNYEFLDDLPSRAGWFYEGHQEDGVSVFYNLMALLHKDLKCKAPLIEPNLRRNLGKWST